MPRAGLLAPVASLPGLLLIALIAGGHWGGEWGSMAGVARWQFARDVTT
jgi:hypothetical protein